MYRRSTQHDDTGDTPNSRTFFHRVFTIRMHPVYACRINKKLVIQLRLSLYHDRILDKHSDEVWINGMIFIVLHRFGSSRQRRETIQLSIFELSRVASSWSESSLLCIIQASFLNKTRQSERCRCSSAGCERVQAMVSESTDAKLR